MLKAPNVGWKSSPGVIIYVDDSLIGKTPPDPGWNCGSTPSNRLKCISDASLTTTQTQLKMSFSSYHTTIVANLKGMIYPFDLSRRSLGLYRRVEQLAAH